ncbi:ARM repeat-containing protein [Exidia glandulosa HHB12029]|uniref:ARM repeat-containing protein n=1 Tax=Exidia glandulosa HHB12029 TaxID=1314781 RepID=A0A165FPW3_EXIGL|nr:ARM repeat-containing protein [Exidia glandulosa HHB12029]
MTKEGAALTPEGRMKEQSADERDDPPAVLARCRRLLDAGAVAVLSNISRYARESPRVGRIVAEALLSFVEDKADRGKVLQGGGAKTLLAITRVAFAAATASGSGDSPSRVLSTVDPADLLAAQALAKLAITSPPLAVFGPGDSAALDAIRPLSALLLHPSATRLQTFEGLMALTNLASASPDMADRITTAPGVAGILETLLLDEHELVRRAAAELTCNILSGSPTACERVVSSPNRLTVLLALADVEDVATRSAVAGALACIAHDPRASRVIAEKSANVASLVTSGDDGLAHRGVVVILGALEGLEEDKKASFARAMEGAGVVTALVAIAKRGARAGPLIGPTVEVLKAFNALEIPIAT